MAERKAPTGPREARPDDRLRAVFVPEDPANQNLDRRVAVLRTDPAMRAFIDDSRTYLRRLRARE